MRTEVAQTRLNRQQGRVSDIASMLSTRSPFLPWKNDRSRRVRGDAEGQTFDQRPSPTVVEVDGRENSPTLSHGAESHEQPKTFAQLQRILIRNELVGASADRSRSRAARGEPDAVTRLRAAADQADR
jgi:hypothetical protein